MPNIIKYSIFLLSCATNANDKVISFEGFIEIPSVGESDKYWVTSNSFFMNNKDPLIAFDIMDKDDVQFIGSEKTAYDFLKSAFSNPNGDAENLFRTSFSSYSLEQKSYGEIKAFILSEGEEIKLFILSEKMPFALNVSIIGKDNKVILNKILSNMKLTDKD